MIIFPYQSLPWRSQMWLWNRWLGQPTKRTADKNRAHKHRLVQSAYTSTYQTRWAHTHFSLHTCMCLYVSLLSADLWFCISRASRLIMNAGWLLTICYVLSPGLSGSYWAKRATWTTWATGKSTSPWSWWLEAIQSVHLYKRDVWNCQYAIEDNNKAIEPFPFFQSDF